MYSSTLSSTLAQDGTTAQVHPLVRSAEACYVSTARTIGLADRYGARLHVCHVTTARELTLLEDGPTLGKRITAEACIPHLWFSDEDYPRLGNRIKCNPAIKSAADREALRGALRTGRIDLVATDHAPHTAEEKSRGYWEAPSGMPSVQFSLPAMFDLAARGVTTLEDVVEKMCHAPAVRFGIAGRGFLRPGYKADIAIVDPAVSTTPSAVPAATISAAEHCSALSAPLSASLRQATPPPREGNYHRGKGWVVEPENILSKCGWSPWEGVRFEARVVRTIVGGRVAWDGERVAATAAGERLKFN